MNYSTIGNHMGTYERNKKGAQGGLDIFKINLKKSVLENIS
jgi:hypothetical protein